MRRIKKRRGLGNDLSADAILLVGCERGAMKRNKHLIDYIPSCIS
jgi:hypothetical protein